MSIAISSYCLILILTVCLILVTLNSFKKIRHSLILDTILIRLKNTLRRIGLVRILYTWFKMPKNPELIHIIEQNRMVVLKPHSQPKKNNIARMIVHGTVKDFLEHYGAITLRKSQTKQFSISKSTILLPQALALLKIPFSYDYYLRQVGAKTRNTIRKSERQSYIFQEFDWNNHLDNIYDINTSKKVRSAGLMHGWYIEPVKPIYLSLEEKTYIKYYGVFKDTVLCAYLNLIHCGNFAFFKYFIGNADHLKNGIMNYLLSRVVKEYINHSHIEWLNYGWMSHDKSNGESSFKRHNGFKAYATFFDLDNDKDLIKYSMDRWRGYL